MFLLGDIQFFEIPNFLLISIVGMLIISLLLGLVMGRFLITPVITFIVLAIAAFVLPNFFDIKYNALLGYAIFLAIIALILDIVYFFVTKERRQKKKMQRKAVKDQERFDNEINRGEARATKIDE